MASSPASPPSVVSLSNNNGQADSHLGHSLPGRGHIRRSKSVHAGLDRHRGGRGDEAGTAAELRQSTQETEALLLSLPPGRLDGDPSLRLPRLHQRDNHPHPPRDLHLPEVRLCLRQVGGLCGCDILLSGRCKFDVSHNLEATIELNLAGNISHRILPG